MKIFVNCQKDAFNKSYNSNSKKYNMGQAMIDAVADKEMDLEKYFINHGNTHQRKLLCKQYSWLGFD